MSGSAIAGGTAPAPTAPGTAAVGATLTRRGLLLAGCATLAACSLPRTRRQELPTLAVTAQERAALGLTRFRLQGRVAIAAGNDGGSGRLDWQQDGEQLQVSFHSGLGGRRFELQRDDRGARLREGQQDWQQDASVNRLLRTVWDIDVPVLALSCWLRGARQPGSDGGISLDAEQRALVISQHGWQIEYLRWQSATADLPPLPTKLYASRADQSVRLAIRDWQ